MNRKQILDVSTGEWHGFIDDDCVIINKDPSLVAGVLEGYNLNCQDMHEVYNAALRWFKSEQGAEQELYLMKVLERVCRNEM